MERHRLWAATRSPSRCARHPTLRHPLLFLPSAGPAMAAASAFYCRGLYPSSGAAGLLSSSSRRQPNDARRVLVAADLACRCLGQVASNRGLSLGHAFLSSLSLGDRMSTLTIISSFILNLGAIWY